jgi:hypothetical protein
MPHRLARRDVRALRSDPTNRAASTLTDRLAELLYDRFSVLIRCGQIESRRPLEAEALRT